MEKNKLKSIWALFLTFFKIGLFTFGGGYAMFAVIEDECVERKKWITADDMMNVTVIAESTPGPVAINTATFVGFSVAGIWGSIAATLGVVLPSFIIIYLISMFLDNFLKFKFIASAFKGIKLAVGVLILNAAVNMLKKMDRRPFFVAIFLISTAAMLAVNIFSLNFSTISLLLITAALSLVFYFVYARKQVDK